MMTVKLCTRLHHELQAAGKGESSCTITGLLDSHNKIIGCNNGPRYAQNRNEYNTGSKGKGNMEIDRQWDNKDMEKCAGTGGGLTGTGEKALGNKGRRRGDSKNDKE